MFLNGLCLLKYKICDYSHGHREDGLQSDVLRTVGKGNVIKMKQKKTVDAGRKAARPSIRKVGTMLGSGALCVLAIGTISICGMVNQNRVETAAQNDTTAAAVTTTTTEKVTERQDTVTSHDTVTWRKASINEYEIAEVETTTTTAETETETSTTTEKVTEKKLDNVEYVSNEIVNLREKADKNSDVVAILDKGDSVIATAETSNGWCAVTYGNYQGYIMKQYLTKVENTETTTTTTTTAATTTTAKKTTTTASSKAAVTTASKAASSAETKASGSSESAVISYTDEEFDMLCYVLQGEVGNCSDESKIAVANVIINRVKSSRFPNTVKGVLTAANQFTAINGYYNKTTTPSKNTIACAEKALNGEDTTNGATYYYAPKYCGGSTAAWFESLNFCMEIDGQRYFKNW